MYIFPHLFCDWRRAGETCLKLDTRIPSLSFLSSFQALFAACPVIFSYLLIGGGNEEWTLGTYDVLCFWHGFKKHAGFADFHLMDFGQGTPSKNLSDVIHVIPWSFLRLTERVFFTQLFP